MVPSPPPHPIVPQGPPGIRPPPPSRQPQPSCLPPSPPSRQPQTPGVPLPPSRASDQSCSNPLPTHTSWDKEDLEKDHLVLSCERLAQSLEQEQLARDRVMDDGWKWYSEMLYRLESDPMNVGTSERSLGLALPPPPSIPCPMPSLDNCIDIDMSWLTKAVDSLLWDSDESSLSDAGSEDSLFTQSTCDSPKRQESETKDGEEQSSISPKSAGGKRGLQHYSSKTGNRTKFYWAPVSTSEGKLATASYNAVESN